MGDQPGAASLVTPHLDFYDIPAIDPAVTSISDWFARHLGTGK